MTCKHCGSLVYFTGNRYSEMVVKFENGKKYFVIKTNMTQKCLKCGRKGDLKSV